MLASYVDCEMDDVADDWFNPSYQRTKYSYYPTECKYERMAKAVGDKCKCSARFSLGYGNKTGYANCHGNGVTCADDAAGDLADYDCRRRCDQTTFEPRVIRSGPFPRQEAFVKGEDFCKLALRVAELCGNGSSNASKSPLREAYPDLCTTLQVK